MNEKPETEEFDDEEADEIEDEDALTIAAE